MAKVWVKSLQCKSSSAMDDVFIPKPSPNNPRNKPNLPLSCTSSSRALQDVVFFPKPKPSSTSCERTTTTDQPKPKPKPDKSSGTSFPALTELPEGDSSRRVVEIIFTSTWTSTSASSSRFPGRIEMLFRVRNPPRAAALFEEYRSAVRSLAAADSRCAVDGNEMMRFHCPRHPPRGDPHGIHDASVVRSAPGGGIRTFAGSGGAHESTSGGAGEGTRSMLVCRVITGRVRHGESEGESVSGTGQGELIVFDERAVLPLFLIIYSTSSNTEKLLSRKHDLMTKISVRRDHITQFGRC